MQSDKHSRSNEPKIGGSRKIDVKEGESVEIDSGLNEILSPIENWYLIKKEIKVLEETLNAVETVQTKREGSGGEDEIVMEVLATINDDEEEVTSHEDHKLTKKSIQEKDKEVRCIQAKFDVMILDIEKNLGTMWLGKGFREKYWMLLSDTYGVYSFFCLLGIILGFLGLGASLPSFFGVFSLLAIPSLIIVLFSMNIPMLELLALRFFTILKSIYILIFVTSGVILSRERENRWAIFIFFIITGLAMFLWGLFGDCYYIPTRSDSLQRSSIIISIMIGIFTVLLHTGSLNVADYRIEFLGRFNFSVVTLMASAMSNLFWLNLEIVYVAFVHPTRLVTLFSPITNVKTKKIVSQMIRSAASASKRDVFSFPATLTTMNDKIKYIKDRQNELQVQLKKCYDALIEKDKHEVDNSIKEENNIKEARKTEKIANQLNVLIQSSENVQQFYVIASSFHMLEIDSKNTLGKLLFGFKIAKRLAQFGLYIEILWFVGMVVTLLAMNKVIGDVYALAVVLCLPAPCNLLMLNVPILKLLVFQFETIVITVSSFLFCLCGAILLREREYNYCYFIMFATLWICGQYINLGDSLPGSTRYLNIIIGSLSGLCAYLVILYGVYYDEVEGKDFLIPFFGTVVNETLSNQCASAGFTFTIFMLKNVFNAFLRPEQLVTLQGRLHFSKMKMSEVQVLKGISKVVAQSKSQRNIAT